MRTARKVIVEGVTHKGSELPRLLGGVKVACTGVAHRRGKLAEAAALVDCPRCTISQGG